MDLGPITGIRSVALLNAQRAQREGTPNFEIDAAERSGDEPNSNQQPPERRAKADEEFHHTPEPAAENPPTDPAEPVIDAEGQHNWFV
jgi:hypothetical protein